MSTQQQFNVTVTKAGRNLGTWAAKQGGQVDRAVTDYYPGGMAPARKLFGVPTTSDITVRKLVADLSDDDVRALMADQSNATVYTVTQQRLSASDNPVGAGWAWRCNIKTVTPPDTASDSANAAELSVVLTVIGTPTVA